MYRVSFSKFCGSASILLRYKTSSFIEVTADGGVKPLNSLNHLSLCLCISFLFLSFSPSFSSVFVVLHSPSPILQSAVSSVSLKLWKHGSIFFFFLSSTLLLIFTHYSLIFYHLTSFFYIFFFFCSCLFLGWGVIAYLGRNKSQVNGCICVCVCTC